jgi:short subunit dehydrogenase-like uncharacterized protein
MDLHPAAGQGRWIEPADRSKVKEAIIVDVADKEAQFVTMGSEHHAWLTRGIKGSNYIAMYISMHLIGILAYLLTNNSLNGLFKARWARASNHTMQKCKAGFVHGMRSLL